MLLTLFVIAVSILAAVAPAIAYSVVIWWFDRYEKEPWGLLAASFVWGAIPSVLVSLAAEVVVTISVSPLLGEALGQFIEGSGVAPIVEEMAKGFAILLIFLIFRHEFDGPLDGIVYGALVGFGFGMTENILYFMGGFMEGGASGWVTVVFLRTIVFGLNHGMFGSITGLGFGYASVADSTWRRWLAPFLGLGGAVAAHAVHNTFAGLAGELCWPIAISLLNDWGGVLTIVVIIFLAWRREKRLMVQELGGEIVTGLLGQAEYETVVSYGRRIAAQWQALSKVGLSQALRVRKLHQLVTELAFRKYRLRRLGDARSGEAQIDRLREQIQDLRTGIVGQLAEGGRGG